MKKLKNIQKNIYFIEAEEKTDRPLLALIEGEQKSLMIDTGNSKNHLNYFLELLQKNEITNPDYAVLTHWHWDHSFAVSAADFPVISSELTYEELKRQQEFEWDQKSLFSRVEQGVEALFCAEKIAEEYGDTEDVNIELPDITFSDKITLYLGDLTAEIINLGSEHSLDSSIIWVKEAEVMFLGDIMAPDLYRGPWNYHLNELKALYKKIKSFPAEIYVESHLSPQKREDFLQNYAEIISIGENLDKNNYDLNSFKNSYLREEDIDRTEEIMETAEMFIRGRNIKL
ncbi:MAG: MBL fold metallo-hydrolase [Bacillota bacterium]